MPSNTSINAFKTFVIYTIVVVLGLFLYRYFVEQDYGIHHFFQDYFVGSVGGLVIAATMIYRQDGKPNQS